MCQCFMQSYSGLVFTGKSVEARHWYVHVDTEISVFYMNLF